MTISDFYHSIVRRNSNNDFELFSYRDGLFVGFDQNDNICIIMQSSSSRGGMRQRTKLLSVECNQHLSFEKNGTRTEEIVHIIRCFSKREIDKLVFLELVDATFSRYSSDDEVMDLFSILSSFFKDKSELSESELIGLYAELDTILTLTDTIHIERFWHSNEKMKFDFSFTDKLKLEIKATTKNFREHHFKHEQLATELYDIYICSYMLRHDDEGVSLLELIKLVKPLLLQYPKQLMILNKVLKNTSEEKLGSLKFSPEYTSLKRHFYKASSIPQFSESTPDGVANAEYDCNLDNAQCLSDEEFVSVVCQTISTEDE